MNKKLPSVFANKKAKIENNNLETYYSKEREEKVVSENQMNSEIRHVMIKKKINDLFNSTNFVYKANVILTTKEGDKKVSIIARNNDSLLTINNDRILIRDILDIKKV